MDVAAVVSISWSAKIQARSTTPMSPVATWIAAQAAVSITATDRRWCQSVWC